MRASTRTPSLKAAVYEHIARIGQAVASPSRLELLDLLSQGARTVEALAQQTAQSVAITSHHLQVLRRARLVDAEKAGLYVTYRLANIEVGQFLLELRRLSENRLTEIEHATRQYLEQRGAM
jgi:DNA-binding transcriptional ArsR family regulator